MGPVYFVALTLWKRIFHDFCVFCGSNSLEEDLSWVLCILLPGESETFFTSDLIPKEYLALEAFTFQG